MGLLFKTELGGGGGEEGYVHTELSLILSDTELIGQFYAIFLINENGTRKQVIPKTGTKTFTGNDKVIIESLGNYVIKYGVDAPLDRETTYSLREIKATDSVTISSANFYTEWLATAEIEESDYPTLEDLLTEGVQNEKDVRKLMTVHASADKLIEWYNDNPSEFPLSTFTSSRIAMKWIGLRDYICDKLLAIDATRIALINSTYKDYILFQSVDNIPIIEVEGAPSGYGRLLNESVPTMTSNTTPWGECNGNSIYNDNYDYYKAFDGVSGGTASRWDSSASISSSVSNPIYISYTFNKKVALKALAISWGQETVNESKPMFRVVGSDDNFKTVIPITEYMYYSDITPSMGVVSLKYIENKKAFLTYGLQLYSTMPHNEISISLLQFFCSDYSEEEFGDDGIEMLYDHGVEVVDTNYGGYSGYDEGSITLEADGIKGIQSTRDNYALFKSPYDSSQYKMFIGEFTNKIGAVSARSIALGESGILSNHGISGAYIVSASEVNIINNNPTASDTQTYGILLSNVNSLSGAYYYGLGFRSGSGSIRYTKAYLIKKGA